jgi:hypothetical protein
VEKCGLTSRFNTQERVDPGGRSTRLQVEGFPHRLVFDTETYLPLAQEFYQAQEQTAVNMSLWQRARHFSCGTN